MSDNFQQTVNLRAKEEKEREQPRKLKKKILNKRPQSLSREIDRVYDENKDVESAPDLHKISRPQNRQPSSDVYKKISIMLLMVLVLVFAYLFIFDKKEKAVENSPVEEKWYMIKLSDNTVYYGQISDVAADPIVISNVYYNYDQLKPADGSEEDPQEANSLRLVKRGKESHGPDGTMSMVRSQVLFMEPLKQDSKVLQAIIEYER